MKANIIKVEWIKETEFSLKTTIITLDNAPTIEEQNELFINESVVLEF